MFQRRINLSRLLNVGKVYLAVRAANKAGYAHIFGDDKKEQ
jgi:hypothetical protein